MLHNKSLNADIAINNALRLHLVKKSGKADFISCSSPVVQLPKAREGGRRNAARWEAAIKKCLAKLNDRGGFLAQESETIRSHVAAAAPMHSPRDHFTHPPTHTPASSTQCHADQYPPPPLTRRIARVRAGVVRGRYKREGAPPRRSVADHTAFPTQHFLSPDAAWLPLPSPPLYQACLQPLAPRPFPLGITGFYRHEGKRVSPSCPANGDARRVCVCH